MAKILFFNSPLRENVYIRTNVSVGAPSYPNLTLATLAGHLIKEHSVRVIDLDILNRYYDPLFDEIKRFKPDIVAASAKTPDYLAVKDIMYKIKKEYPDLTTIVGGVHITALPEEASKESCFDIIVIGEGDEVIPKILSSSLKDIEGIIYREDSAGITTSNPKKGLIKDLNSMPYPAWQLFDINKYKNSRLSSRKNPVGLIETSRGCAFECNFCSKLTFGTKYRVKEYDRVVDELEFMLKCGFKEIHIVDDSFTQNINRAKRVCSEIIKRGLKFPWSLFNGIRVDMVDKEFFTLAKKAGCWQIGFGIESGDQEVLDKINKKTKLSDIETAIKLAKKADIDTFGFFIFALSGETEASMKKTIEFAKKLPLDIAKFDICIPYPGTPYYDSLKSEGRIKTEDWTKYICHQINEPLFEHPDLSWETIGFYYKKAFREFYLRPNYIMRRFFRSIKMGDILYDAQYFLKSKWQ